MRKILGLVAANIILIIIMWIITPYFFTKSNLVVLVDNIALEAIALSGYTLLLIGGYFDLSIDGIVSLTGVVAGLMMVGGIPWYIAVGASLLVSGIIGFVNGFIVVKLGINGLIATLTTWWICIGVSLGLTKALSPYGFPEGFQLIGQTRLLGFRSAVLCAIVVVIILSVVLHWHRIGAHIYASGDNKQSSKMMGIDITRLGIGLYVLVGLLSGFIGLMIASRLNAASPIAVDGMALRVIAAVVIGGGSLSGGKGSIVAGLLGLCIMHILSNSMIQLGISPYWQKSLLGGILLIAVLSEKANLNFRRVQND